MTAPITNPVDDRPDPFRVLECIDRLTVGPVRLEPRRLTMPYVFGPQPKSGRSAAAASISRPCVKRASSAIRSDRCHASAIHEMSVIRVAA